MPRLTARQRRFVAEYLRSRNATAAAVAAGYSSRSARSLGAQLLNPKVHPLAAEVGRQLDARNKRSLLYGNGVLRHIHTAILFRPADYALPGTGAAGDGPPRRPSPEAGVAAEALAVAVLKGDPAARAPPGAGARRTPGAGATRPRHAVTCPRSGCGRR